MAVCSLAGLVLLAEPGRASLYSPEAPYALDVDQGKPEALPFGEFKRRLGELINALNTAMSPNDDRQKFLDRIAKLEPKPKAVEKNVSEDERQKAWKKLPDSKATALAADLIRTGQIDSALNLIGPRTTRTSDYFVFSTLAHIHANRGEWADALRYHKEGQFDDTKMPDEVKGLTKQQRDWWKKLDSDYLPHYYAIRKQQADARLGLNAAEVTKANETEQVLPLFPLPGADGKQVSPVRFVNEEGVYQPGVLAKAERAKLPEDAIAVVQQLLLWFPTDVHLYWLLAELYAAEDDLQSLKNAETIFNECVGSRQSSNLKLLMDHRRAVQDDIKTRATQPPTPPPPPQKPPISMTTILIYFGAVGVIAVFALIRVIMKRTRGECGPVG
jgi:hypothetical protein